ncbi:MAG: GNAT family N-acetyltransferase [Minicystis sp.]
MNGELSIRVADRHDLPDLQALYRQIAETEYALETPHRPLLRPIAERIQDLCGHLDDLGSPACCWLVAEGPLHLIGSVCVRPIVPSPLAVPVMEIRDVVVDRNHRRRGIGGALLERAFAWGREHGMRGATLDVAEANTTALRLYQEHGMYPTGLTLARDLAG